MLVAAGIAPSLAQDMPNFRNMAEIAHMRGGGSTVQSSTTLSIPSQRGSQAPQQEQAFKSSHAMSGRSCEPVLQTLADECEIQGIISSVRSDPGRTFKGGEEQPTGRPFLNGSVTMVVKFKLQSGERAR